MVPDGSSITNSATIEVDWSDFEYEDLPPVISAVYGTGAVPHFVNQSTGVIKGLGWHADGVEILGKTGTFVNHGSIYGSDGGVFLGDDVEYFTNTGDITAYNFAVSILGNVGTFNNSGTIDGFFGLGAGYIDTLINSGTIAGNSNIGMLISGAGHIENTGTLSSDTYTAVLVHNDIGSFNNSGTISGGADALIVTGHTGSFFNSGTVTAGDVDDDFDVGAAFVGGVDNLVNTGRIYGNTVGVVIGADRRELMFGDGEIGSTGPSTIFNSGIIETAAIDPCGCGGGLFGLGFMGGTLSNSGVIRSGVGVVVLPEGVGPAVITNSGTIEGTYPMFGPPIGLAIAFDSIDLEDPVANNAGAARDDILRLLPGSRILGAVDFAAGNDTLDLRNYQGSSFQIAFNLENVLTGGGVVMSDTLVPGVTTLITIDDTSIRSLGTSQFGAYASMLRSSIAGAGASGAGVSAGPDTLNYMPQPGPSGAVAAAAGVAAPEFGSEVWGAAFGGLSIDGTVGNAFTQTLGGLVAGTHTSVGGNTTLGGVVSIGAGRFATPAQGHVIDSTVGAVGLYGSTELDVASLDFSLLAGGGVSQSSREVSGILGVETASADFASWFVSPSVALSVPVALFDAVETEAGVSLQYVGGSVGAYDETGASLSLSVPAQAIHLFESRAGLTSRAVVGSAAGGDVTLTGALGVLAQANLGAAATTIGLAGMGGGFATSTAPGMFAFGAYAGAEINAPIAERIGLTFRAGGEIRSDQVGAVSGSAKLAGSF